MSTYWFDANPYLSWYEIAPGVYNYHTGSDLNLNFPTWDSDRFKPVYACARGVVTWAGLLGGTWGKVVVMRHTNPDGSVVHSRYAHLDTMLVSKDQWLERGQQLGTVGRPPPAGAYHLHFDISHSGILETNPGHWPGANKPAVQAHYVNPKTYILEHRPPLATPVILNVVDELPKHATLKYNTRPLDAIAAVTIHHTVGVSTPYNVALYHINTNGWPGIGYHFFIMGNGTIYQTNYLTTVSYHAGSAAVPGDENYWSIGIALNGDFTNAPPSPEQLNAARNLVAFLRGQTGMLSGFGHKEMPGASTACPGATWLTWKDYVLS